MLRISFASLTAVCALAVPLFLAGCDQATQQSSVSDPAAETATEATTDTAADGPGETAAGPDADTDTMDTVALAATEAAVAATERTGEFSTSLDDFQSVGEGAVDRASHPGGPIYEQYCAMCHNEAVAKAPHLNWLELMTPDAVLASMTDGIMMSQAAALSDEEKQLVAEWVTRRSLASMADIPDPPMCEGEHADFDMAKPPAAVGWGHDNSRFVPGDVAGLSKEDLSKLEVKWAFRFPAAQRARSHPAIGMGAVFVGSQKGKVYAFDLDTGCVRWTYRTSAEMRTAIVLESWDAESEPPEQPKLFFGDIIARAYALDARTGELLWQVKVDDHPHATITGTPTLHGDTLYVPVSSLEVTAAADPEYACCTFRGHITALDAKTGAVKWRAYTIDQEPAEVGVTRVGTPIIAPSGAPIWNSPVVYPDRGLVLAGSGENYSAPADDNSNTIFAWDLETGERIWHTQTLPDDAWNVACMMEDNPNCPDPEGPDLDFGAGVIVHQYPDGGSAILSGQKTGVIFAMNPEDGAIKWSRKVGRGSIQGGVHFGMAKDGDVLYVPINDMENARDGKVYTEPAKPGMHALNANTGELLWSTVVEDTCGEDRVFCDPGISAAVTAMPGAVLAGHLDGKVRAYDRDSGEILWEFDTVQTEIKTVTGEIGRGGSMSGGAGPAIGDGHVAINSGYGLYYHEPGDLFIVFGVPDDQQEAAAP